MRSRWTSFVASPVRGRVGRALEEEGNPKHRARVVHDKNTILVHLSDEAGPGWTVLAVNRRTRAWTVAQEKTQMSAATQACERLYQSAENAGPRKRGR